MDRASTRVTVLEVGGVWSNGWPPENLLEFYEWVAQKIESIPEEYRSVAKIEIEAFTEYDSASPHIAIYYLRP